MRLKNEIAPAKAVCRGRERPLFEPLVQTADVSCSGVKVRAQSKEVRRGCIMEIALQGMHSG